MADSLEIEPLLTEIEAARLLGIKWKWLRSERYKGRISWKQVAGKAMYRRQDLIDWQKRGVPCQEEIQNPVSSPGKTRNGRNRSSQSAGTIRPETSNTPRPAQVAAEKLLKSLRDGSKTERLAEPIGPAAPVIPMKRA